MPNQPSLCNVTLVAFLCLQRFRSLFALQQSSLKAPESSASRAVGLRCWRGVAQPLCTMAMDTGAISIRTLAGWLPQVIVVAGVLCPFPTLPGHTCGRDPGALLSVRMHDFHFAAHPGMARLPPTWKLTRKCSCVVRCSWGRGH